MIVTNISTVRMQLPEQEYGITCIISMKHGEDRKLIQHRSELGFDGGKLGKNKRFSSRPGESMLTLNDYMEKDLKN